MIDSGVIATIGVGLLTTVAAAALKMAHSAGQTAERQTAMTEQMVLFRQDSAGHARTLLDQHAELCERTEELASVIHTVLGRLGVHVVRIETAEKRLDEHSRRLDDHGEQIIRTIPERRRSPRRKRDK